MWQRVDLAWGNLITGGDWRHPVFIPDGLDPVPPLGALIATFLALCAKLIPKYAMSPPGPRRRALLERHKAIRAKLSPTELPALEPARATPQQSSKDASTWGHKRPRTCLGRSAQQQLSMDQQELQGARLQLTVHQQQLQGAQHQLALDQQQLQGVKRQLTLDQEQLQGAQHQLALDQQQLALDQQQLKGAQQQLALDQQQLKGAQQQQAQALEQLQSAQQQQAQALEQLQNSRTGLERSELLLRQHMDACMRAHTMDLPSLAAMQPEMWHICFMRNCVPRAAAQAAYSPAQSKTSTLNAMHPTYTDFSEAWRESVSWCSNVAR
ncbi:ABC transporter permease protein [Haematococcus lacustris]|uniref:ABC transporter permease protein n=1 Tax=Haematococcus lacustris TaxID=44745 RepID=A0A699Y9I2_HAELA|nr:ABC transporter permease protein [Haematococcus lacustris]